MCCRIVQTVVEKRKLATRSREGVRNRRRYGILAMGRAHGVLFAMNFRHK